MKPGSLFTGLAPYGRLRMHLNLALWHLRQANRIIAGPGPIVGLSEAEHRDTIDLNTGVSVISIEECLALLGGVHPINTEYGR